ncbi:MAG: methylmalonyl-CoA epimerase [Planctomycetota bacterium]
MIPPLPPALKDFPLAHLAVAVEQLDRAAPVYRALGFELHEPESIPAQQVRAQLAVKGELRIELLEPEPAGAGPIGKHLAKRGAGVHHVALRVKDLKATLMELEAAKVKSLPGYPSQGLGGSWVAFLDPKSTWGVLYELVEATQVHA